MTTAEALRRAVILLKRPGHDEDDSEASRILQRLHDAIGNVKYTVVFDGEQPTQ